MKLSDALMLNGITKRQGYGFQTVGSLDEPCAIGGALQAIGKQVVGDTGSRNYAVFQAQWPWTSTMEARCPECGRLNSAVQTIWQLNDLHHWSRKQIAAWIARIEPQEPEQTIEELVESAEVVND